MKRRCWQVILFALLVLFLLVYSIYNAALNEDVKNYLSVPFYAIINICIAIFIAFFLTQHKTDVRKRKETAEAIIGKILMNLSNENMYKITCKDSLDYIRVTQRSVYNRLNMLKQHEKEFNLEHDDLEHVLCNFELYWQNVSNHIGDLEHLKKCEAELYNLLTNVTNSLERMVVCLYCDFN